MIGIDADQIWIALTVGAHFTVMVFIAGTIWQQFQTSRKTLRRMEENITQLNTVVNEHGTRIVRIEALHRSRHPGE